MLHDSRYMTGLHALGLSEKSAAVYVAALRLGTASIQDIARAANVKRPTAYLHTQDLLQNGLLEKIPSGKKEYFRAVDPGIFQSRADEQHQAIQRLVPELQALRSEVAGRPRVSILEGRKGIEQVYQEICQANSIRFWSDLRAVEDNFLEMFTKIADVTRQNEIRVREIINNSPEAKTSCRRWAATAGPTYSARLAAKPGIKNDNAIYGDTVAMFRIEGNNLFVVLIKEPAIVSTMKALFDMAWEGALPFVGR